MQSRISMVTLGVVDLEISTRFYAEGLGLPRLESPPGIVFFNLDGSWLALYGREALAEDAGIPAGGRGFSGVVLAHNVTSEVEVDRVMSEAVAAGAGLVRAPRPVSWGGYSGYFSDPDGHLWEVAYNPHFWIGPPDTGE